jgi:hypothetical protein
MKTIQSVLVAATLGATLVHGNDLRAQATDQKTAPERSARWEIVVPTGTLVPTGEQRDAIKRGNLSAIQLTFVARPTVAIISTFGWARSRDIVTSGDPKLDVFTYDVGAELRAPRWIAGKTLTFSPFAGVGAGGRSYNHRTLDVDATHNLAAYGSVGGELGYRRIRLRIEARDYVSGFEPLVGGGATRSGNDVVVMVGLRLASR